MPSYLHLQFPASDIPAQARELYKQNWLRMIPDVDYVPVPIVGHPRTTSGGPIDLTFSLLLRGGELWGLISCVHRSPKHIPQAIRTACLAIGQLLSLQISAFESLQETLLVEQTQPLLKPLIDHMKLSAHAVLDSLTEMPAHLLGLTQATGAAIVSGDEVTLLGACPARDQAVGLARWAAEQAGADGLFATAELPLVYAPAVEFCELASGLLFAVLPKPTLNMLLWFRPEVARTIVWAGEPSKLPTTGQTKRPFGLAREALSRPGRSWCSTTLWSGCRTTFTRPKSCDVRP
ncbi:MAG: hypothetical protein H7225_16985 [Massilia sp.]|nr:hypothetical protein [Aquabacterium sp.]